MATTTGEEREGLDESSVIVADDKLGTWSLDPGHVELHEQYRERQRQNQYELHWRQQQMVCMRVFRTMDGVRRPIRTISPARTQP